MAVYTFSSGQKLYTMYLVNYIEWCVYFWNRRSMYKLVNTKQ